MTESRTTMHEDAERRMRELIEGAGLPEPDRVSYEFDPDEVAFFWPDRELVVVVELDGDGHLGLLSGESNGSTGFSKSPE